jgi:ParB-like chromosome segregation protein Spo0J
MAKGSVLERHVPGGRLNDRGQIEMPIEGLKLVKRERVVHPDADLFPMLPDDELQALADDIKANGLVNPIILMDGEYEGRSVEFIVDGRNRLKACELAGIEPRFERVEGDAATLAVSLNTKRRNLEKQQLAVIAAKAWKRAEDAGLTVKGRPNSKLSENRKLIAEPHKHFGELYGVKRDMLYDAKFILDNAPELIEEALLPRNNPERKALFVQVERAKKRVEERKSEEDAAKKAELLRLEAEAEWKRLSDEAPDLAQLVAEERMSSEEARALYRQREEKRQREKDEAIASGQDSVKKLAYVAGHVQAATRAMQLGDEMIFDEYYFDSIRGGLDALKWLVDEIENRAAAVRPSEIEE